MRRGRKEGAKFGESEDWGSRAVVVLGAVSVLGVGETAAHSYSFPLDIGNVLCYVIIDRTDGRSLDAVIS